MIVEEKVYLEHFGVKGMKWGVRRDWLSKRQSRIKAESASAFLAKADKMDVRISQLNREISALPPGARNYFKKNNLNYELSVTTEQRNNNVKKAEKAIDSRLTPMQKRFLIGTAIVGGTLAAVHLNRTGGEDISSAVRRSQSQRKFGSIFKIDKNLAGSDLSPKDILTKVSKPVNPHYNSMGGKMNCRRATFAHELRRRGYDVQATPSIVGRGQSESGLVNALIRDDRDISRSSSLSRMLVGGGDIRSRPTSRDTRTYSAFTQTVKKMTELPSTMSKMPSGARGEIVFDEGAFAHSMAWEKFKDGTIHIFDSQKGTSYPVTESGLESLMDKWGEPGNMEITRLDNVDLDLTFLSRWASNLRST